MRPLPPILLRSLLRSQLNSKYIHPSHATYSQLLHQPLFLFFYFNLLLSFSIFNFFKKNSVLFFRPSF